MEELNEISHDNYIIKSEQASESGSVSHHGVYSNLNFREEKQRKQLNDLVVNMQEFGNKKLQGLSEQEAL